MVPDRDQTYLKHILDEINKVEVFLDGVVHEDFVGAEVSETNYAVVRCLEIIGEAAARVSTEYKADHPEVKWGSMIGMRNKIIHEYMEVDYEVVWETAKTDLPILKESLSILLGS